MLFIGRIKTKDKLHWKTHVKLRLRTAGRHLQQGRVPGRCTKVKWTHGYHIEDYDKFGKLKPQLGVTAVAHLVLKFDSVQKIKSRELSRRAQKFLNAAPQESQNYLEVSGWVGRRLVWRVGWGFKQRN